MGLASPSVARPFPLVGVPSERDGRMGLTSDLIPFAERPYLWSWSGSLSADGCSFECNNTPDQGHCIR